jgi:hypothetical protein
MRKRDLKKIIKECMIEERSKIHANNIGDAATSILRIITTIKRMDAYKNGGDEWLGPLLYDIDGLAMQILDFRKKESR